MNDCEVSRPVAFVKLSDSELVKACSEYVRLVEADTIKRADFWGFCAWIGEDSERIKLIIRYGGRAAPDGDPADESAAMAREAAKYAAAGEALRRLSTYIRSQYNISPAWSGASTAKALFLQRQDWGDGGALTDKASDKITGDITIKLVGDFGGVGAPFD